MVLTKEIIGSKKRARRSAVKSSLWSLLLGLERKDK